MDRCSRIGRVGQGGCLDLLRDDLIVVFIVTLGGLAREETTEIIRLGLVLRLDADALKECSDMPLERDVATLVEKQAQHVALLQHLGILQHLPGALVNGAIVRQRLHEGSEFGRLIDVVNAI